MTANYTKNTFAPAVLTVFHSP